MSGPRYKLAYLLLLITATCLALGVVERPSVAACVFYVAVIAAAGAILGTRRNGSALEWGTASGALAGLLLLVVFWVEYALGLLPDHGPLPLTFDLDDEDKRTGLVFPWIMYAPLATVAGAVLGGCVGPTIAAGARLLRRLRSPA